jgi:hypothetical protein
MKLRSTSKILATGLMTAIGLGSIQNAQALPGQCKLSRGCEYGPEISDRWITADRLVAKAEFSDAIVEYQKALKAAETLNLPNRTAAQIKVLRACAIHSSRAHLEGLKQARDFQATHMVTAENYKMAVEIYRDRVQEVMAVQDTEFPELVGKCP